MKKNDDKKRTICFLVGAGADHPYGFPLGVNFMQQTLTDKDFPAIFDYINSDLDGKARLFEGDNNGLNPKNTPLINWNASSVLYQTIIENEDCWKELIGKENGKKREALEVVNADIQNCC